MFDDSSVDERRTRIGRVSAYRVRLPEGVDLPIDSRRLAVSENGVVCREGRVERDGFERPEVVGTILATRFVTEVEKIHEPPGGEPIPFYDMDKRPVYDLMEGRSSGFVLCGGRSLIESGQTLELYLKALKVQRSDSDVVRLDINDAVLKKLFFAPHVSRRSVKAGDRTTVLLSTRLPELTEEFYYKILEANGIKEDPWKSVEIRPPGIAGTSLDPPHISVRPDGFTVKSSYLHRGVWDYVRWLLLEIERALSLVPVTRRHRVYTLSDFATSAGSST